MQNSITKTLCRTASLVMLALSVNSPSALAGELAGATLPDTLKSGDITLKLNGFGLRKKAMIKTDVARLYLESPRKMQKQS